jgi:glutaminyl-tRNA synthetase
MNLDYTKGNGLIPAIIQDSRTQQVLMLGYMNEDAFNLTRKDGRVHFFSRTKNRIWLKGETSENYLYVKSIKAERVDKDENGEITTIYATYDEKSKSGSGTEESLRKVKGTLHWVSAKHALPIKVRMYNRLFTVEQPDAEKETDFLEFVNPDSMEIIQGFAEPALADVEIEQPLQFQRLGYFTKDRDSTENELVFNQTVTLKDSFKPE